jgi:Fe-S oxidoreductase
MEPTPFDIFVLPFTLGMAILLVYLALKYAGWIWYLPATDQKKILFGFFSFKTLKSIKEIFIESLIHRKIFRANSRLGYMHMSLAFGWFLLILFGAIEAHTYVRGTAPFYFPIFFKFFVPDETKFFFSDGFVQLMDLFLLFVLSGLAFAIFKRLRSKTVGLKKTTKLSFKDRIVLTSLWLIFPFRLLAESTTSGLHHSGGFMTGSLGSAMAGFLPLQQMEYPLWWAYSIALCFFFLGLPFSRYMHIPTEMVLIFFRNWGIKLRPDNPVMEEVMLLSCPRCGICIDQCQLNTMTGNKDTQAVYFLQRLRNNSDYTSQASNCLMCGRCESACPVGIDLNAIRLRKRHDFTSVSAIFPFDIKEEKKTDVVFFTGCMGHLTPNTKDAMVKILDASGDKYWFMDANGGICCGRPLKLAGQLEAAQKLVEKNRHLIQNSGAKKIITSCPICYKTFKEDYNLNIEVLHHTQYIHQLIAENKIDVEKQDLVTVYHDPCELGRGSDIYQQPRDILTGISELKTTPQEGQKALCCGGSLANTTLPSDKKVEIATQTMQILTQNYPDVVATACPLCKKTLLRGKVAPVLDIAELVIMAMQEKKVEKVPVAQL